ncbi:MAG: diaminopimelate decarboxylase [Phycisphaerae bacterium]
MDNFQYIKGQLYCEDVPILDIINQTGTPTYIYSQSTLLTHFDRITTAFAPLRPLLCYSIKSCGNLSILEILRTRGSGFDVVSGGELFRALQAGADAQKIVFAGVGKTDQEINEALDAGIGWFNIESEEEFWNLDRLACLKNQTARAALRVNPDVTSIGTHQKTLTGKKETKFGVDLDQAEAFYLRAAAATSARLTGLHLHIGSPIKSTAPYVAAITKALTLMDRLSQRGLTIDMLDIGGGFAAFYEGNEAPSAADYAAAINPLLQGRAIRIILEPGRSISCNAGILVTRVQYTKHGGSKVFTIVDAAMNDLIRPTLYESYHFIWPVEIGAAAAPESRLSTLRTPGDQKVDVVGPICESGDYFAQNRYLPPTRRGDLLAVFSAGAYGFAMSSQYNARPRAAEVLVNGKSWRIIRRRETYQDLVAAEL